MSILKTKSRKNKEIRTLRLSALGSDFYCLVRVKGQLNKSRFARLRLCFANASSLRLWREKILRNQLLTPKKKGELLLSFFFGAGKRTWTFTKLPPLEPESSASANSAIPAYLVQGSHLVPFGARNGTWTRTVWTTRPSNVRVCQFRHSRIRCLGLLTGNV